MNKQKVMLIPLDPVHDVGLKMIRRGLDDKSFETFLLQPDLPVEEVIEEIVKSDVNTVLVSRTLGYGVAEVLASFVDLLDAAGIRKRVKIGIGGMAIRPEFAAELGFDAGFGPGTTVEEAIAFVEGREYITTGKQNIKQKRDFTSGYGYSFRHQGIKEKLDVITDTIIDWAQKKTSPGVQRAKIREELWDVKSWRNYEPMTEFEGEYVKHCGELVRNYYEKGVLHPKTRRFTKEEVLGLEDYVARTKDIIKIPKLSSQAKPLIFNQYGTGCPFLDVGHIKVSEAWGADGVVHFDPSWGARTEGFLDGFLTHQEDGTVITPANLNRIERALEKSTLWQIRAHRGLNTPETVVLAGKIGADLTKINICYGSLGAGTDPARLTVDAIAAIRFAAKYGMPFDVVTNEELCGVPAAKAFAGMLITAALGVRLGGKPILQPLFCYSPEVMIGRQMKDNYIEFNAAKVLALKAIIEAPIWPGAPVGFLTQTEDRVQSSVSTALHAALAALLGVEAVTIASADEAYSGGPITVPSKIDTLRAVGEALRFYGHTTISQTKQMEIWRDEIVNGIDKILADVVAKGDFVQALYDGVLGSREDGAYPGRNGRDTVVKQ